MTELYSYTDEWGTGSFNLIRYTKGRHRFYDIDRKRIISLSS